MLIIISAASLVIYNGCSMEMLRFYVYTQYKSGITTDIILQTLLQVHGHDKAPGRSTVFRWVKQINKGTFES